MQTAMNQILIVRQAINNDLSSIDSTMGQMLQALSNSTPISTTSGTAGL
jgi:hypothetical protein